MASLQRYISNIFWRQCTKTPHWVKAKALLQRPTLEPQASPLVCRKWYKTEIWLQTNNKYVTKNYNTSSLTGQRCTKGTADFSVVSVKLQWHKLNYAYDKHLLAIVLMLNMFCISCSWEIHSVLDYRLARRWVYLTILYKQGNLKAWLRNHIFGTQVLQYI